MTMTFDALIIALSLTTIIISTLALITGGIALIKIIGFEKSTHKVQFIDPMSMTKDEDLDDMIASVPQAAPVDESKAFQHPLSWDLPDEDFQTPANADKKRTQEKASMFPPLTD